MHPLAAIIILLILLSSAAVNFVTIRRLLKLSSCFRIWMYYAVSASAGLGLFIWLTFYFSYHPSPTLLFYGAPIPFMFFQLEGSNWTDFPPPAPIQIFIIISNFFVISALIATPILAWTFLPNTKRKETEQDAAANP